MILENFFGDLIIRPHVQNDHEGNIVTVIHWYGNELYIGDNIGKVSIFTLVIIIGIHIFVIDFRILHYMNNNTRIFQNI